MRVCVLRETRGCVVLARLSGLLSSCSFLGCSVPPVRAFFVDVCSVVWVRAGLGWVVRLFPS